MTYTAITWKGNYRNYTVEQVKAPTKAAAKAKLKKDGKRTGLLNPQETCKLVEAYWFGEIYTWLAGHGMMCEGDDVIDYIACASRDTVDALTECI